VSLAFAIREQIALRSHRAHHFDPALFGEPAWALLLDLALARIEGRQTSVTSACIASAAPATTALRYIGGMVDAGLLVRMPHPDDRRSVLVCISDDAFARIAAAFGTTAIARAA